MTTPDDPTPQGEFLLYTTEDGRTRVQCRFEDETLWLSQKLMAELYGKDVRTINEHLQTLFEEGEIDPAATIRKFRIVRQEGKHAMSWAGSFGQKLVRRNWHPSPSPRGISVSRQASH